MEEEFRIIDITRTAVEAALPKMLEAEKCCTCKRCRLDVEALALNTLSPKYVVSQQGDTLATYSINTSQRRTEIYTAIIQAISTVKKNPHHP